MNHKLRALLPDWPVLHRYFASCDEHWGYHIVAKVFWQLFTSFSCPLFRAFAQSPNVLVLEVNHYILFHSIHNTNCDISSINQLCSFGAMFYIGFLSINYQLMIFYILNWCFPLGCTKIVRSLMYMKLFDGRVMLIPLPMWALGEY